MLDKYKLVGRAHQLNIERNGRAKRNWIIIRHQIFVKH